MNLTKISKTQGAIIVCIIVLCPIVIGAPWYWSRGDALVAALKPLIETSNSDLSKVARAILDNFHETRLNASIWSGVYWGCTFLAAVFSALAGLILKFEVILKNVEIKKDVAALLAVLSAIIITISTSGDFQRKWQANRIAASEFEQTGYYLLENTSDARSYFKIIGNILHKRNMAVVGNIVEQPVPVTRKESSKDPK